MKCCTYGRCGIGVVGGRCVLCVRSIWRDRAIILEEKRGVWRAC